MGNFYKDNQDLQFYINKWIKWNPLVEVTERKFGKDCEYEKKEDAVNDYKDILDMVGTFTADEIAPLAPEIDKQGITLVDGDVVFSEPGQKVFDQIRDLGLHGLPIPREFGGMNSPLTMYMITLELLARADVSTAMHYGFHSGLATVMLAYSNDEGTDEFDPETKAIKSTRFQKAIEEIANGDAWGCMDITESDAGSDMGAIRTKAFQDKKGNWFITGQKIFITSGHGKYHFVIARTEEEKPGDDSMGLNGLSFFLVEAYSENKKGEKTWHAKVDRIEEKLGIHGSPTCTISFEKTPAQLVGKPGDGFRHMLLLMNNARVAVGSMSLGVCESAVRLAKDYASQRKSMGKTIDQHEMIADYLSEMETDTQGLRAITISSAYHEEMTQKLIIYMNVIAEKGSIEYKRMEKDLRYHKKIARRLTPLVKYFGSEKSVELSRRCIQIHGGSGFTTEYGAEKLLRDAIILPIYEGTSQIQALMVMKDSLGAIIKNPQKFVKKLASVQWLSLSSRDSLEKRVAKMELTGLLAQQHLMTTIATKKFKTISHQPISTWTKEFTSNWDPKKDFAPGMLHAERLIKILTDVEIAKELLRQGKQFPERKEILERFIEKAEIRGRFLYEEIKSTGSALLEKLGGTNEKEQKHA